MDWHIITSSKGGVGKTLLSVMLLIHHLTPRKSVLVIDLNGMNPDLRLLVGEKEKSMDSFYPLQAGTDDNPFPLTCYKVDFGESRHILGWPTDPYKMLCGPSSFFGFLDKIRNSVPDMNEKLGFKIDTIIIDTNFHFCNIFSDDVDCYEQYQVFKKENGESFFIWFIWVFRQLQNLLELDNSDIKTSENNDETQRGKKAVKETDDQSRLFDIAKVVEQCVKNRVLQYSPFVHVFNTTTVMGAKRGFIFRLFGSGQDITVEELKSLMDQGRGKDLKFDALIKNLKKYQPESSEGFEDVHEAFLAILKKFAESEKFCPLNVVPLPNHHKVLSFYTDDKYKTKEWMNWVKEELGAFKSFKKSLIELLKE